MSSSVFKFSAFYSGDVVCKTLSLQFSSINSRRTFIVMDVFSFIYIVDLLRVVIVSIKESLSVVVKYGDYLMEAAGHFPTSLVTKIFFH
mgnify:CR=1 FL=1